MRPLPVVGAVAGLGVATVAAAAAEAHAYRVVRHELTLGMRRVDANETRPRTHLLAPGAVSVVLGAGSADPTTESAPRATRSAVGTNGTKSLRILHLSDTHFLPGQRGKARFLASLASLEPDLVVFTGDILASDRAQGELMAGLDGLLGLPGVFVFGSNDYFGPAATNPLAYLLRPTNKARRGRGLPWRSLRDALTAKGWHDLNNAACRLDVAGLTLDVRGTDDAHIGRDDYAAVAAAARSVVTAGRPEGARTGGNCPTDGGGGADLVLGVTHAPYARVLGAMADDGVRLVLAGHTHGGQICLPWGAVVTNCDLPTGMAKGLHEYRPGRWLHVSAGIGSSPTFPLRLFCRPEACLLDVMLRPTGGVEPQMLAE